MQAYIDGVMDGSIVAGKLVRLAVQRQADDMQTAGNRGFVFSEFYANAAVDYFPCLRHTSGEYAGQPFELRMFQKFIIWVLFGWREKGTDLRRFRYAFVSEARGNGKSPFGAAIGNYLFTADNPIEPRAQVYAFATKEQQSRDIVFKEAKAQIDGSPGLCQLVDRLKSNMSITSAPWNGSVFEPKGSDSKTSDGWILHGAIVDELHAWQERHRGLFEKIETAMAKRRQPLCLIITTAGDDSSDIWQEQYDFYVSILTPDSGVDSDRHFAFIAEMDKTEPCEACRGVECRNCGGSGAIDVDPLDSTKWPQANPMLNEPNSPVKIDALHTSAAKARAVPSALNSFRRFHCNQQVASFFKLIPAELWARGNRPLPDLKDKAVFCGFDWGWRNDLAALGMVFPLAGEYAFKCKAWVPEGCDRNLSAEPWASWIRSGDLVVTDGNTTDVDFIYREMEDIQREYEVRSIAYDPNNAREFSTKCVNEWGLATFPFSQSCRKYNEPTRKLCELLREGKIMHGGNSMLAWCAQNVSVKEDSAGYIMPSKVKSADKIDPMVAIIMGLSEAMFIEQEMSSVFDLTGDF